MGVKRIITTTVYDRDTFKILNDEQLDYGLSRYAEKARGIIEAYRNEDEIVVTADGEHHYTHPIDIKIYSIMEKD